MDSTKKIYIDFQGGSHGNYLEFVCNRFLAGIPTATALPFNSFNAAHKKQYLTDPLFKCNHFTTYGITLTNETVISIHIAPDDLLPLQCVSLLRAGDRVIKPEELEIDTYHKLANTDYEWVLDNIINSFFNDQDILTSYQAIADPGWPKINSVQDYYALPEHIRNECELQHGLTIPILDKDHPHCPREILIEFFQIGFSYPATHGFIKSQETQIHTDCDIYKFPFDCFYDINRFVQEMTTLADFLQMPFSRDDKDLIYLHREFLKRQPYKDIKKRCDHLVDLIVQKQQSDFPVLDVVQEAYVRAMLTKHHAQ